MVKVKIFATLYDRNGKTLYIEDEQQVKIFDYSTADNDVLNWAERELRKFYNKENSDLFYGFEVAGSKRVIHQFNGKIIQIHG